MTPEALIDGAARVEPARPRRRRLPDGPQGVADRPRQSAEAEVPRRQRRRVGARRVQGPRGDGAACRTGCIEGCLIAAHAIESTTSSSTSAASTSAEYEILQRRASTRRAPPDCFGDVEIVVHRGAGAYICGEETALLESLEGQRGQPRPRPPFPPVQGLYDAPTQINNVVHDRDGPADHRDGRAPSSRRSASENSPRHGDLLDLRQRRARPATTSSSSARRCAS